jgi:hypothetical protein
MVRGGASAGGGSSRAGGRCGCVDRGTGAGGRVVAVSLGAVVVVVLATTVVHAAANSTAARARRLRTNALHRVIQSVHGFINVGITVRRRHEACLERGRRKIYSALQRRVKESTKTFHVALLRVAE